VKKVTDIGKSISLVVLLGPVEVVVAVSLLVFAEVVVFVLLMVVLLIGEMLLVVVVVLELGLVVIDVLSKVLVSLYVVWNSRAHGVQSALQEPS